MPLRDGDLDLERRVAALDEGPASSGPRADIRRFIEVTSRIHFFGEDLSLQHLPCVSVGAADGAQARSRVLARLSSVVPEITQGPIELASQYWVGGSGRSHVPKEARLTLDRAHFSDISDLETTEASSKPFWVGLFTSTGLLGTYGMWRTYLDLNRYSTLHPTPWSTWEVHPHHGVVVQEISCAREWVAFVLRHAREHRGLLYPDWKAVGTRCDAVHMTLRAILATQGLYFRTREGIVAGTHWDVESTLWLRWCFDSAALVERVG